MFKKNKIKKKYLSLFKIVTVVYLWVFFSSLYSPDTIFSLKRSSLFLINTYSSLVFFIFFFNSERKLFVIKKSLLFTIFVYCFFSIIQILIFFYFYYFFFVRQTQGSDNFYIDLLPTTVSALYPRIAGGFVDPNIAGYFLGIIYIINLKFKYYPKLNYLIFILIIITFSRSAILSCFCGMVIIFIIDQYNNRKKYKFLTIKNVFIIGILILICSFIYNYADEISKFEEITENIESRTSGEDESTSLHLQLINRAYYLLTIDSQHFFIGSGFGASPFLLTDIFGSKYGNFHSEFLTIFVEIGLVGLILYCFLFFTPLIQVIRQRQIKKQSIIIVLYFMLIIDNIFYQQFAFSYYWIILIGLSNAYFY